MAVVVVALTFVLSLQVCVDGDTWTVGLLLRGRVDLAFTDGGRRHQACAGHSSAGSSRSTTPILTIATITTTVWRGRCAVSGSSRRMKWSAVFRSAPRGYVSRAR